MPVVAASLIASPLGWVYYGAWLLPGTKVTDWDRGVALGWCAPMVALCAIGISNALVWATLGSCYGVTLIALWYRAMRAMRRTNDQLADDASTTQSESSYNAFQPLVASR
jgi:hypothetical protein